MPTIRLSRRTEIRETAYLDVNHLRDALEIYNANPDALTWGHKELTAHLFGIDTVNDNKETIVTLAEDEDECEILLSAELFMPRA